MVSWRISFLDCLLFFIKKEFLIFTKVKIQHVFIQLFCFVGGSACFFVGRVKEIYFYKMFYCILFYKVCTRQYFTCSFLCSRRIFCNHFGRIATKWRNKILFWAIWIAWIWVTWIWFRRHRSIYRSICFNGICRGNRGLSCRFDGNKMRSFFLDRLLLKTSSIWFVNRAMR